MLMFEDNKIKMARKPGKKLKENQVGCTGQGINEKEIEEKGQEKVRRERIFLELSLEQ